MKITKNSSQEQELAVQYKILALDLFKILSLPKEDRGLNGSIDFKEEKREARGQGEFSFSLAARRDVASQQAT
jgi:hypothetical protein